MSAHDELWVNAANRLMNEPRTMQDVYCVGSGQITIQWPERMTADEVQDFEALMALVLRKVKRTATLVPADPINPDAPDSPATPKENEP